tara:strand:- start:3884 stop:6169 length:2286 start_codon:yes stop_codon:yes gene_type:complete
MPIAKYNKNLENKIFKNEGFRENVYDDGAGFLTIGFGFTKFSLSGKNGIPSYNLYWNNDGTPTGKIMTREEAEDIAEKITQTYIDQVNNAVTNKNLTEFENNALVDLYYRNGSGNIERSGIIELVNQNKLEEAADLIERGGNNKILQKAGGKVLESGDALYRGITGRNKSTANLFRGITDDGQEIEEQQGATYQVYDGKIGEYTTFTSSWDGKNWKHTAEGNNYTQDEIDGIAGMFTNNIGLAPDGQPTYFKKEEVEGGGSFAYVPYTSPAFSDQEEYRSRFAFYGEVPISLTIPEKERIKFSEAYAELQQQKNAKFNPLDLDKEQNNKLLADSTKKLNDAAKIYKTTRKPEDKAEYERIKEEHDNFVNTLNTGTGVLGTLVEKEKRLREQMAKMQEDPLAFDDSDTDEIQKKIDKVAIEISIEQGNPRQTGPFGHSLDDLQNINLEVDSFGLDGEVYNSTEQKNNQPKDIESITVTSNVPEVFITANKERNEEIDKEKKEEEIIEKDPNVKTENYLDGLGNLGTTLERGLGIVQEIKELIGNNDDLELAALGKRAYMESLKTIKPDDIPPLSNMYKQHLNQLGQLSKMGFSVEEAQKARTEIDGAYGKGIENAVRGTAGDRAKFLAMSGVLDSQRQSALLDFAAKDSELNRRNQDSYTKALSFAEEYNLNKSKAERADDLKLEVSRQQGASNFAAKVFQTLQQKQSDAQLNPIIRKYKQMITNNMSTNTPLLQNPFSYFGKNNDVYNQNTQNNQNTNTGN